MNTLEDKVIKKLWGENPEGLFSTHNLFEFGMYNILSLKEEVANEDSDAAERISKFMTLGLTLILQSNPFDLRDVYRATRLILDYAFGDTFVDYKTELEAHLMALGQKRNIEAFVHNEKNKKKGFKWENLPEFYA